MSNEAIDQKKSKKCQMRLFEKRNIKENEYGYYFKN